MGGTGANFQAWSRVTRRSSPTRHSTARPPCPSTTRSKIPDPVAGTNNYYTQDGYGGGSYVNCADPSQPGVAAIAEHCLAWRSRQQLRAGPLLPGQQLQHVLEPDEQRSADARPRQFTLPPQSTPTIADVMTEHGVSWKYYSADRGDDRPCSQRSRRRAAAVPCVLRHLRPADRLLSIMKKASEEAKLQNYGAFLKDVHNGTCRRCPSCGRSRRWPVTRPIRRRICTSCSSRI